MVTSTLSASPVERLVRPPDSGAVSALSFAASLSGGSNAAHHAPAGQIEFKSRADAGRVHALVRPTQSAGVKPPEFAARRIQSVLTTIRPDDAG